PGVGVFFCPEILAIYHAEQNNTLDSISKRLDWELSLDWIRKNRHLVTSRAYSSFIMTHVGWRAAARRSWSGFVPLLWDAYRNGSLRPVDLLRYVAFWGFPPAHRKWVKRSFHGIV